MVPAEAAIAPAEIATTTVAPEATAVALVVAQAIDTCPKVTSSTH